eukprot:2306390-Lingulodinium_polyedra.AAC.1
MPPGATRGLTPRGRPWLSSWLSGCGRVCPPPRTPSWSFGRTTSPRCMHATLMPLGRMTSMPSSGRLH